MFGSIYRKITNKQIDTRTSLLDIEKQICESREIKHLPLSKAKTNLVHARGNIFPYDMTSRLLRANSAIDKFNKI